MNELPPQQPDRPGPGSRSGRGNSVLLGILVGVLYLGAAFGLGVLAPSWPPVGWVLAASVLAYLVVCIVFTGLPRTERLGTGLLIAFGVAVLVGAGLCVALVSGLGQSAPSHG